MWKCETVNVLHGTIMEMAQGFNKPNGILLLDFQFLRLIYLKRSEYSMCSKEIFIDPKLYYNCAHIFHVIKKHQRIILNVRKTQIENNLKF